MPDFDTFAPYYDADMGSFDDDLPLYRELARRSNGLILDAMCGTGRVIVPLAEAGHHVVGLDIAPAMVEVVERKIVQPHRSHRLAERLRVVLGDVRSFDLPDRFDLVLVPLNSFMHLETVGDQLAALQAIRRHLLPRGQLVIDLFNPDPRELLADQGVLVHERTFQTKDGHIVQKFVQRRAEIAEQRQTVEFVYDEIRADGTVARSVLPFVMRWLYRFELEHVLARAGFAIDGLYGDYDLEPYTSESPQLIAMARPANIK